jgi:signal recognition particle receptor subunit alpha
MLDFFVIFSKSGIVLFATVQETMRATLNHFIRLAVLENRPEQFTSDTIALAHRLDNEFDLLFVVGYQKMLRLSYIDKFLDDIQLGIFKFAKKLYQSCLLQ